MTISVVLSERILQKKKKKLPLNHSIKSFIHHVQDLKLDSEMLRKENKIDLSGKYLSKTNNIKGLLYDIINHSTEFRQEECQVYPAINPLDMSNEMIRIGSLAKFPDGNHPSLIRLAESGFYSEGKGRELKCFSCGTKYDNWSFTSVPVEIHRGMAPDCGFLKESFPFVQTQVHPSTVHRGNSVIDNVPQPRIPQTDSCDMNVIEDDGKHVQNVCTDSSSALTSTLLISSSAVPFQVKNSLDSNYGSLSYGSYSTNPARYQTGPSTNSAFVTSLSTGHASSDSGFGSGSSGFRSNNSSSSGSSGLGSANSSFRSNSSSSSGSSGYGSANSSFRSNSSSSSNGSSFRLPPPQLPVLNENSLENQQNKTAPASLDNSTNVPKERYPEYKPVEKRRASYKNWPSHLSFLHPLDLSECGFFYSNFGDCVRCYHCGIGLRNWESDDNPWVEHARWSTKCPYLIQKKGKKFIDTVLNVLGLQQDAEPNERTAGATAEQSVHSSGTGKSNTITDPIDHPAAQYVIKEQILGDIKDKIIKKAMNQLLQKHEWDDVTKERLIDFLLENRMSLESSENKPNQANLSESAENKPQSSLNSTNQENTASNDEDPGKMQEENEKLKDLYTCKICLDEKVGITFVPCGHLVTCKNCSPKIRKCPMCRTFIRGTIKTTI